ncbi:MAG: primosomal protein N' [Gammaproteobacteria bacterium]|nr:primosomal protein N' [Gammaproteobacteria bacterium]MCY4357280.1 primosomal protein N' [Gammaproteobacteria bacterium]
MAATTPSTQVTPILRVAIPAPLRRLYDYLPPAELECQLISGVRVLVPFGPRHVIGMVMSIETTSELRLNQLKRVSRIVDSEPLLQDSLFQTLTWAAAYYQHPVGDVFHTALPVKLRRGDPCFAEPEIFYSLHPQCCIATAQQHLKRATRQLALLQFIARQTSGVTSGTISKQGFQPSLLKKLLARDGYLLATKVNQSFTAKTRLALKSNRQGIKLNTSQQQALNQINKAQGFQTFLLHGVTGSGKTEVYMRAMEPHLLAGRQCLLLVPEIGLTPQTMQRFEQRFSCYVVSLHSGLTDTERLHAWRAASSGRADIIIGTRSAVFTPMPRPGLIIIDEEHDGSFKQQDGFRYSARDVAIKRAHAEDIVIVLGSATPSLESMNNARRGKFILLGLPDRAGGAKSPTLRILDIAQSQLEHGLSETLVLRIEQHLNLGNQVLVFVNRRGYAPVLQCKTCAWISECDQCIARMTVHTRPPELHCHHCESKLPLPHTCPNCGSTDLSTLGTGTQKLEEFLKLRFDKVPVIRIDRDSTRSRRRLHDLLDTIKSGNPSILLGTQMLAKGHHFPAVTLVAIVDADMGLFSADFRGQEQMAQTIVQVAGRAGRADRPGEVLVQSRHAHHPALSNLVQLNYADYAHLLLAERKTGKMPPFSHLALFNVESPEREAACRFAVTLAKLTQQQQDPTVETLGPVPAPMEKRAGRFRLHLQIKSFNRSALQRVLRAVCKEADQLRLPTKVRWSLDVDPTEML